VVLVLQKARFTLLIVVLVVIIIIPVSVYSESVISEYYSPQGIIYKSYSKQWSNEAMLKLLHDELLNNTHGQELNKLKYINIYPDYSQLLRNETGHYSISYRIMQNGKYEVLPECTISLYGGDTLNTVDLMAGVLSKQYGKHFTQYYILKKENIILIKDGNKSKYAEIRGLNLSEKSNTQDLQWDIENIAANDYVQIFGSKLARKHFFFPNLIDQFEKNPNSWKQPVTSKFMYNLSPQDNLQLPLASEVNGLRDYWFNLSNVDNKNEFHIEKPRLYVSEINELMYQQNSVQITLSWDTITNKNQKYNYTLVTYGDFDPYPMPIITYENIVGSNKTLHGKYGAVISKLNNVIHYNKHVGFYGKKTFRVFVSDNSGNMVSSNKLTIDLSQSPILIIDNQLLYIDIIDTHWASNEIKIADGYNIIRGFPDKTFRANQNVTRAELLTMLHRVYKLSGTDLPIINNDQILGDHWFIPIINDAMQKNVIDKEYYGNDYANFIFDQFITREEVAMICAQILKLNGNTNSNILESNITDIQNSKYYNEIQLVLKNNIIKGFSDNTYKPKEYLTRAQAVVIACRLLLHLQAN
jgi:uncharacterized protein (UPF0333 family)